MNVPYTSNMPLIHVIFISLSLYLFKRYMIAQMTAEYKLVIFMKSHNDLFIELRTRFQSCY